jgi:hypothetical protein
MADTDELIKEILDMELEMFLSVPADGEYSCQSQPESFRLHRGVQFSIWSRDTLESYLHDLRQARNRGVNLMTIKYARMDDIIPRENHNPLIEEIAAIQCRWQQELFEKYPGLMAGARPLSPSNDGAPSSDSAAQTSFETYLRGELETYSDNTLSLLYRDMTDLQNRGINGSERVYERLTGELGYKSIEDADRVQRERRGS